MTTVNLAGAGPAGTGAGGIYFIGWARPSVSDGTYRDL